MTCPGGSGCQWFIGTNPPITCVMPRGPRSCFRAHFLTSSWDPHFSDFGANLAPTCLPSWSQNPPKIGPRAFQVAFKIASYFWSLFGLIFDGFLVDFRPPKPSKIAPKSIKKSTQQANNQNSKNLKKYCVLQWFLLHRPCHVEVKNQSKCCQEPFKNNSQINTPTCIDFGTNLAPFWEGLGGQVGTKLAPNRSKSRS